MSSSTLVTTQDTTESTNPSAPDSAVSTDCPAEELPHDNTVPKGPQHDDEFWLDDGNLILIAGDVEFRVYKGPLIASSPVFKTMLSLPQPDGVAPQPHCVCKYQPAVVQLSESPEDIRHLLRALVPGKTPR